MKNKEKFFLVGCGKMGLPILKSILKMFPENPFVVVSRDPEKLEGKYAHLAKNLKFRRANSITVEAEDTIIFAVPPQKATKVLQEIKALCIAIAWLGILFADWIGGIYSLAILYLLKCILLGIILINIFFRAFLLASILPKIHSIR